MWYYLYVFIAALIVDIIPFFGPPAWTTMVFFQTRYDLNIWAVLFSGVIGSTIGRYILSKYISLLSSKIIKQKTIKDIEFIGKKLGNTGWSIQLFVLLYTLMPLPSTPLFTATGMAKIKPLHILPAFFIGKFTSDMVMVISGNYVARNVTNPTETVLSWQIISGTIFGVILICLFLFIDWRKLLQNHTLKLNFNIWK